MYRYLIYIFLLVGIVFCHLVAKNEVLAGDHGSADAEVLDGTLTVANPKELRFGSFYAPTSEVQITVNSGGGITQVNGFNHQGGQQAGEVTIQGPANLAGLTVSVVDPQGGAKLVTAAAGSGPNEMGFSGFLANRSSNRLGGKTRSTSLNGNGFKLLYFTGTLTIPANVRPGNYSGTVLIVASF